MRGAGGKPRPREDLHVDGLLTGREKQQDRECGRREGVCQDKSESSACEVKRERRRCGGRQSQTPTGS